MINEFEDENLKKSMLSNQWTYGQLFPELLSPGPVPISLKHRTHTFSSRFSDTVSVWNSTSFDPQTNAIVTIPERKGKLWVYFAPMNDLLNLSVASPIGVDTDTLVKNAVFYASSNGPMPSNNFGVLNYREITMNNTAKRNLALSGYKKIRVTSAALIIKQIGPVKERSGILKIGMGYKGAIERMPSVIYDKFENYFNHCKIVNLNESGEAVCRFRLPAQLIDTYAPFDPTTSLPYFFIYGEGISTKISFEIDVVRHFEGMILPEFSSFHQLSEQPMQSHLAVQSDVIKLHEHVDNIIHVSPIAPTSETAVSFQSVVQQGIQHPTDVVKQEGKIRFYEPALQRVREGINKTAAVIKQKASDKFKSNAKEMIAGALRQKLPKNVVGTGQVLTAYIDKHYNPGLGVEENFKNIGVGFLERFLELGQQVVTDKISMFM